MRQYYPSLRDVDETLPPSDMSGRRHLQCRHQHLHGFKRALSADPVSGRGVSSRRRVPDRRQHPCTGRYLTCTDCRPLRGHRHRGWTCVRQLARRFGARQRPRYSNRDVEQRLRRSRSQRRRCDSVIAHHRVDRRDLRHDRGRPLQNSMKRPTGLSILVVGVLLAGCQGSSTPKCSFSERTVLAQPSTAPISSTWPKFRADAANTGRTAVDLGDAVPQGADLRFDGYCSVADTQTTMVCQFGANNCPNQPCVRIGATPTTPIISQTISPSGVATQLVFVASNDGTVYFDTIRGNPPAFADPIQVQGPIDSSPLLGADGSLYVSSNNTLYRFITNDTGDTNRTVKNGAPLSGFVAASPNIWNNDGTVFVGSQTGNFPAVCSNGVPRFVVTVPPNPTTAIVVQDPNKPPEPDPTAIVVVGGVNGQVRAHNLSGNQVSSFFASATINAALVADLDNPAADPANPDVFYVADSAGRLFVANLANGQPVPGFDPPTDIGPISASPALGRDAAGTTPKLYVAGQNGILYALNRTPGDDYGHVCWFFDTGGQINSS